MFAPWHGQAHFTHTRMMIHAPMQWYAQLFKQREHSPPNCHASQSHFLEIVSVFAPHLSKLLIGHWIYDINPRMLLLLLLLLLSLLLLVTAQVRLWDFLKPTPNIDNVCVTITFCLRRQRALDRRPETWQKSSPSEIFRHNCLGHIHNNTAFF